MPSGAERFWFKGYNPLLNQPWMTFSGVVAHRAAASSSGHRLFLALRLVTRTTQAPQVLVAVVTRSARVVAVVNLQRHTLGTTHLASVIISTKYSSPDVSRHVPAHNTSKNKENEQPGSQVLV